MPSCKAERRKLKWHLPAPSLPGSRCDLGFAHSDSSTQPSVWDGSVVETAWRGASVSLLRMAWRPWDFTQQLPGLAAPYHHERLFLPHGRGGEVPGRKLFLDSQTAAHYFIFSNNFATHLILLLFSRQVLSDPLCPIDLISHNDCFLILVWVDSIACNWILIPEPPPTSISRTLASLQGTPQTPSTCYR